MSVTYSTKYQYKIAYRLARYQRRYKVDNSMYYLMCIANNVNRDIAIKAHKALEDKYHAKPI